LAGSGRGSSGWGCRMRGSPAKLGSRCGSRSSCGGSWGEGEGEPLLLFGPGPQDPHADHAALARALIQVVGELGASRGQNIPLWHWLDCQGQPPSHALALDWGYERKEALIRAHASQLPGEKGPRGHLPGGLDIVERARQRDLALGAHLGCAWAEPFVRTGAQIAARPQRLACVEGFDTA
jgi:LmbE family N-acetylglucosaminyl deacetylase